MKPRKSWILGLATALGVVSSVAAATPAAVEVKVHPRVSAEAAAHGEAEFLVFFEEQADLSEVRGLATKHARGRRVFELLAATAARAQAPLLQWLEARAVPHRSFWIANMIWARADPGSIAAIAERSEVLRIDANPRVALDRPVQARSPWASTSAGAIEWGILKTKANEVWSLGYDGSGIVVAGQDTGYQWNHPALIGHYRGWNGSAVSHAYNWRDAIHSGGGVCGANSPAPCDDVDHGTHTMGTMVGDDGGVNRIGMAPGAKWIGCRNMDEGLGTPATYSECFQFFLAPTDLAGNNPDPSKAPHVISNSWGCPTSEGCSPGTLQTVVDATRAAGIVLVASAGNAGSGCGTIEEPPGIYASVITVGSTDSTDKIADSSSRGPVTADGSNRLKPDVAAPGVEVRSSVPGGYESWNGTSMAAPHVAGLVALLLDAREDLIGRVEEVEAIVRLSAEPKTHSKKCGGIPGSQIPNPIYGHGRIDALEAVTGDPDGDGVGNLTDCAPIDGASWSSPGPAAGLLLAQAGPLTQLAWNSPANPGASAILYDVLRSDQAGDFSVATCLASDVGAPQAADPEVPQTLFFYLVRAQNACGGNLGASSGGIARSGAGCPASP